MDAIWEQPSNWNVFFTDIEYKFQRHPPGDVSMEKVDLRKITESSEGKNTHFLKISVGISVVLLPDVLWWLLNKSTQNKSLNMNKRVLESPENLATPSLYTPCYITSYPKRVNN